METVSDRRAAVVAGDVTVDWNLARVRDSSKLARAWSEKEATRASFEPGGAALLGRVISAVATDIEKGGGPTIDVRAVRLPEGQVSPTDERFHHSFAIWSRFEGRGGTPAWRVEDVLGLDPATFDAASASWLRVPDDLDRAGLVVLDDGGLGFREHPELWPPVISDPQTPVPWTLLKMAKPVADGPLWEHLQRRPDRLIVVVRIDDLRLTEARISRELSWERTAEDLMWELVFNRQVNDLARCAHVIVSFNTAGALLLSAASAGSGPRGVLFFDPGVMEDMWLERYPGGMIGYTSCLAGSIARQIMVAPDAPDLHLGIQRGLAAMRALHLGGYAPSDPAAVRPRLVFPLEQIVEELADDHAPFAVAEVPHRAPPLASQEAPGKAARSWTILEDLYPEGLEEVARRIVLEGVEETLEGVPVGAFGKLLTVDRNEIEGYRSIGTLIRQYAQQDTPETPLSIAVFGPPGSGKSFGVKQVARSLLPGRIEDITFNLSQFHHADQLLDALHQVRDLTLSGKLPLVFWDEFDTTLDRQELGWLRHFLSPMQDGTFQEGQITHPIGPAVFVFAGGTSHRMQDFGSGDPERFRSAKGPDFVSRLKGYVNVLGPNPIDGDADGDPYYLIRRAILWRSMLLRAADHLFRAENGKKVLQIDSGVLRATLLTWAYRHGARSMESIIAMSLLSGRTRFERSCLPSEDQLGIHVDAANFLELVLSLRLEGKLLEELAEASHVQFCVEELAKGSAWGEASADYLLRYEELAPYADRERDPAHTKPSLVSWDNLGPHDKEQNRGFVRDIPNKLAAAGYAMRQARSGEAAPRFTPEEVERLAELEHDRWTRMKLIQGWSYGPERDDRERLHPAILPWREMGEEESIGRYGPSGRSRLGPHALPDTEKDKDRAMVRKIARMLAATGYTAVKISDS